MKNPFKFGTIVEEPYFTNRVKELMTVNSILKSENHLIIISPRRYGKTSLINKVVKGTGRPFIILDFQLITGEEDFAAQLLKRIYRVYPAQKIKDFIKNFRIVPTITLNPVSNEIDVSYKTTASVHTAIEDVLNLLESLSTISKKLVVIFDEFQEIKRIGKDADKVLRSIMQHHKKINYVFLGSQESLIREIFEKKKSPFYHFGFMLPIDKIPGDEFMKYLKNNFKKIVGEYESISESILEITKCHPYYTQQLAFTVWELLRREDVSNNPVETAVSELIKQHDIDYERLWNTLNSTDMKILIGLSISDSPPLSNEFSKQFNLGATSTTFSSLKRLMVNGFIVRTINGYEIDDPYFKEWIKLRRGG